MTGNNRGIEMENGSGGFLGGMNKTCTFLVFHMLMRYQISSLTVALLVLRSETSSKFWSSLV